MKRVARKMYGSIFVVLYTALLLLSSRNMMFNSFLGHRRYLWSDINNVVDVVFVLLLIAMPLVGLLSSYRVITSRIIKQMYFVTMIVVVYNFIMMPVVPLFGPDAIGYLGPALRYYEIYKHESIATRGMIYPTFVSIVYALGGGVMSVLLFQRVMFFIALLIIRKLLTITFMVYFRPYSRSYRYYEYACNVVILYLATNENIVSYVSYIHPESLTVFINASLIYGVILIKYRFKYGGPFVLILIIVGSIMSFVYVYQPRWFMLLPVIICYLLVQIVRNKKWKGIIPFFVISILTYHYSVEINRRYLSNDHLNVSIVSRSLFAANMNNISELIKSDLEGNGMVDRGLMLKTLEVYEASKSQKATKYHTGYSNTLGYNVDYIMFDGYYDYLYNYYKKDDIAVDKYFKYWLYEAIKRRPFQILKKVCDEFVSMNFKIKKYFYDGFNYDNSLIITRSVADEWAGIFKGDHYKRLVMLYEYSDGIKYRQVITTKVFNEIIGRIMEKFYPIVFVVSLIVSAASIYRRSKLLYPDVFLYFQLSVGLGISMVFMVQPIRYSEDMQFLSVLFVFVSLYYIAEQVYNIINCSIKRV